MREQRQTEAVESYDINERLMIIAAPRFGKIKVTIDILKKFNIKDDILIIYPRKDIQDGWESDFQKWDFDGNVEYVTSRSIAKKLEKQWKMVIVDEIHEMSENQLNQLNYLKTDSLLALTGTVTQQTQKRIYNLCTINICYEYTIDKAVEEGILADYTIHVHTIPLDNKMYIKGKTEKRTFDAYKHVYNKAVDKLKKFHMNLKMISLIQGSPTKKRYTKHLLEKFINNRVLVFCGTKDIADDLGCKSYHSGNKDKQGFLDFCKGVGDKHLSSIRMVQAGITIKPINKGVINYTSGNPQDTAQKICRFLGLEYDNLDKKAELHIVCSNEKFEMDRISTALMFFDEEKIKWI